MITSKLDDPTKFALGSMGIDVSFFQEGSFRGDGLNLYAYAVNNPINFVDPSGHCKKNKDTYRAVDLTQGMNMYDPNSQLAQYIHDVQGVTYAILNDSMENAFTSPTAGNLYPPSQFRPYVIDQIYEELGYAIQNKKNEPAVKMGLRIVKEAEDIYKSIQEGVSVGGPDPIAVGVTSIASYLYKKNPENIEPGYLQDYLFSIWSNSNKKSLIINVSKALYIKNTEYKYLINSVGAREKFIERLNDIKDVVRNYKLSGFDQTTQNNIRYLATKHIDRIIEMNNNYSDSVRYLENRLQEIDQEVRENLR